MGERLTYKLENYDYELPEDLIAQKPADRRDQSRLMVLYRKNGRIEHHLFSEILRFLHPGDLIVINDTKVVPARLNARKATGGRVELLVLDPYVDSSVHECLTKASKPLRPGMELLIETSNGFEKAEVVEILGNGKVNLKFPSVDSFWDLLEHCGKVPLPPYIKRDKNVSENDSLDFERYQTIYATKPGAVAAPTAGFHFSKELMEKIESKGISFARVTLHVGYGTFSPIRTDDIRHHRLHSEWCEIAEDSVEIIRSRMQEGQRIIAVGTTVVRVLEWIMTKFGEIRPYSGFCDHYIYPGYEFKIVNAMITNFHLPRSSLILLVSAFAGREKILRAYKEAVKCKYRFFSYGDAMFIV